MIDKETIEKIRDAARIEEVIEDFIQLKKRGVNYIGICPFHNEKTPSFTVSPAKGLFKCFGCGKGGDSITFIMEHEQATYPEALRYIANKYGIEIKEKELSEDEKKTQNQLERLFSLTNFAYKYFSNTLWETEEGKAIGLTYLRERGFNDNTINAFSLGYSPDKWTAFTDDAIKNGYTLDDLEKTGLSIVKKEENKKYDRFRNRVIFPFQSISGKIIGFTSRILTSDKNKPKYVNSPESPIYSKGKILYGLYQAKSEIVKQDNCYLAEGNTDVISLHQNGVKNVVASSGTALTIHQIKLIKRFTRNITIIYDSDTAGIKASFKGIDMVLKEDMNIRIVLFPQGEDPDSYAKNHSSEELSNFIVENSSDFIIFKTQILQEDAKNDPVKKANMIKQIMQSIAYIPDELKRNLFVKECSSLLNVEESVLINNLNSLLKQDYINNLKEKQSNSNSTNNNTNEADIIKTLVPNAKSKPQSRKGENPLYYQERELIRIMIKYGDNMVDLSPEKDEQEETVADNENKIYLLQYIIEELARGGVDLEYSSFNKIFEITKMYFLEKGKIPKANYYMSLNDPIINDIVSELVNSPYELSENWEKKLQIEIVREEDILVTSVDKTILSIQSQIIVNKLSANYDKLKECSEQEQEDILREIMALEVFKKQINEVLHRIIIK